MSKVALVLGGCGTVGSASVKAFLRDEGCSKVVVTSRQQDKLDKLCKDVTDSIGKDAAAKIIGIVGDPGTEAGAEDLGKKAIAAVGEKIDYIVSAMGFPWHQGGPLSTVTREKIMEILDTQFFPTFGAWKVFMPLVKNAGGSYVIVTGGGADTFLGPGTAGITIGGSAAQALARFAMKETSQDGFITTEVSFNAGIAADPNVMPPGFTWLSATDAGSAVLSVALKKKAHVKTIVIKDQETLNRVIADGDA